MFDCTCVNLKKSKKTLGLPIFSFSQTSYNIFFVRAIELPHILQLADQKKKQCEWLYVTHDAAIKEEVVSIDHSVLSVCMFSMLLAFHFLRCRVGEIC